MSRHFPSPNFTGTKPKVHSFENSTHHIWMFNGLCHRGDGPAVIETHTFQGLTFTVGVWIQNGRLFRADPNEPVIESDAGFRWFMNGSRKRFEFAPSSPEHFLAVQDLQGVSKNLLLQPFDKSLQLNTFINFGKKANFVVPFPQQVWFDDKNVSRNSGEIALVGVPNKDGTVTKMWAEDGDIYRIENPVWLSRAAKRVAGESTFRARPSHLRSLLWDKESHSYMKAAALSHPELDSMERQMYFEGITEGHFDPKPLAALTVLDDDDFSLLLGNRETHRWLTMNSDLRDELKVMLEVVS